MSDVPHILFEAMGDELAEEAVAHLRSRGIDARIVWAPLETFAPSQNWPEGPKVVVKRGEAERADALLKEFWGDEDEWGSTAPGSPWDCPRCAESHSGAAAVCWQCGATPDGHQEAPPAAERGAPPAPSEDERRVDRDEGERESTTRDRATKRYVRRAEAGGDWMWVIVLAGLAVLALVMFLGLS